MKPLTILVLVLAAGCAASSYIETSYYAVEPQLAVEPSEPAGVSLGMRPLEAARTYGTRIVARDADLKVTYLPHVAWVDKPADAATRALVDALSAVNRFEDVGNAADMFAPDYILTGEVRRFDVLRTETPWRALCEVRLELRAGRERTPVWQEVLRVETPAEASTMADAARAMSDALGGLATNAAHEIANAVASE